MDRLCFAGCCWLLFALSSWCSTSSAAGVGEVGELPEPLPQTAPVAPAISVDLVDAMVEWETARQQLIEYRQITLPSKRRALDDAIRQAEAELRIVNRRIRDYRPFLRVGDYSAVRLDAEYADMGRMEIEQELRELREARIHLMRFSHQTDQLYQLELLRAALRVRAAQR